MTFKLQLGFISNNKITLLIRTSRTTTVTGTTVMAISYVRPYVPSTLPDTAQTLSLAPHNKPIR